MPTLPLELMKEVTKHLPKRDMCNMALLCKAFGAMAQQVLYRHITLDSTKRQVYMRFSLSLESQPPRCKRLHYYIRSIHFTMGYSILRRAWPELFPVMMHMKDMLGLNSFTWSTDIWSPLATSDLFCGPMRPNIPDKCKSVLFYVSY